MGLGGSGSGSFLDFGPYFRSILSYILEYLFLGFWFWTGSRGSGPPVWAWVLVLDGFGLDV